MPAAEAPVSDAEAAALFADLVSKPALILAVSGGPDSTALMWLAARWRKSLRRGPKLIAVTIDHGLRKESAREALAVKRFARELGVEHRTLRWTGRKPATGLQEAARNARYRLLDGAARKIGAWHILTAHTLDDQAETVLFRLARGSGMTGLRGMAHASPLPACGERESERSVSLRLLRPLLAISKSRLVATLAAAQIPFATDPSNRDPRFTRPRLRELLPGLAAEGLDASRLASFARRMARADQAIEHMVDKAMAELSEQSSGGTQVFFAPALADLPQEVALRLLARAIALVGEGPVELGKLEALCGALAESKGRPARFRRTLAGAQLTRDAGRLTVERAPPRRPGAKTGKSPLPKGPFTKR